MIAIGQAARQSGVGIETIRYSEREGIVPAADRTASGRRVYSDAAVARLRFIKRCRDLGFSIPDATALLALSQDQGTDCATALAMGERHLENVRQKIAELRYMEQALLDLTANCADGRVYCPMLDQLGTQ